MQVETRYKELDGVRGYAATGVALMHIEANSSYKIEGVLYNSLIPSFSNFIYLFMMISAFSLCCGYYEKFKTGKADLEQFYKRRYQRIWPFFAILCTIELVVEHNMQSLFEWFTDLTLAYGLLPNAKLEIVGVGWFLGLIFAFYMIFPFFVFLISNKTRAWFVLVVSIVLNILCQEYFFNLDHAVEEFNGGSSLIYSSMFFVAGGLIYLYRNKLSGLLLPIRVSLFLAMIVFIVIDYFLYKSILLRLLIFSFMLMLIISSGGRIADIVFKNRVVHFLGGISMEVYLCHMFAFRILQKVRLVYITGNDYLDYWITCVLTLCGAIVTATIIKTIITKISNCTKQKAA